ncbi:hypothetical protein DEM34_04095 [Spiribacter halobius]|uniref:Uncharacterized protein n=1 Tax=Sediminicurvatus halobius TaxID=2182432 RepID=A0A2U2N642_9GAMM|nr:hypothetical protein [Spiribacter halobius]PWG64517.1 hypothetical protein DEM34_04095 [Spiribacter halobius]UEX79871.1 hypothetical protein LMH63_05835 [Spiribacter halobius]
MSARHRRNATDQGRGLLEVPELNVALFAFLLNYPWEFLQVPFFRDMPTANHWDAIVFCTRAAGGDALIALAGFWIVALVWKTRGWILRPRFAHVAVFVLVGVLTTVAFEWHATVVAERWTYASNMPVIPVIGTGLSPVLQWVVLPPLVVWLVKRQIGP